MNLKKIACSLLATLFCGVNFCYMEVNALFGNTHFNLGEKIIERSDVKLSESEKNAFLSGIVYADIGRFKFDKETNIDSDSTEFVAEMKKLAETNNEKWFTRGFEMHVFQDKKTRKFLEEVLEHNYHSYTDYMLDCGTLDSYFAKKSGILHNNLLDKFNFEQIVEGWNINDLSKLSDVPEEKIKDFSNFIINKYSNSSKKNELTIYENLIQKTYKSLGFELSLDDIREQAGNLLGVFIIVSAVVGNKIEMSEELISKIEEKSDQFADLCIAEFKFKEA